MDLSPWSSAFGDRKKRGPRLGSGAPEGAFQLLASFSHQRVGSSILASLSEAGGNDLQEVTSKPLPPRLPLFTSRHLKPAHALSNALLPPNVTSALRLNMCLSMFGLA